MVAVTGPLLNLRICQHGVLLTQIAAGVRIVVGVDGHEMCVQVLRVVMEPHTHVSSLCEYNQLYPSHTMTNAASEDRTHDLRIMRPTRYQLRYRRL